MILYLLWNPSGWWRLLPRKAGKICRATCRVGPSKSGLALGFG